MKNTYLIYKDPKAEKKELIVATPKQWDEIMKANRGATQEERRYFTCDCFEDCGELDRMYIEVEKPEFDKWHSQNVMRGRNRKLGEQYAFVSTSQEIPGTDLVYEDIIADSSCNVEEEAEEKSEMAALRERLTSWKSYGVVFLDLYKQQRSICYGSSNQSTFQEESCLYHIRERERHTLLSKFVLLREAQKCPYILKFLDFCAIIICRQRKLLAFKTMKPFRRSLQFSLH